MNNRLYVGNLSYSTTNESLTQAFGEFGNVASAKLVMDRETGRSKGFAFVEMETDAEAQAAINALDGQSVDGRAIKVNVARPPERREGGFGGGNRSGGGGYRGGDRY
ncbi:RNA-binding protein [Diaphorobacter sp. HDW4A]|uniref:RNA recognition motif domain-containing protein n=1 Tax=Diaphorobacter sp. HDW4A TaxID=2714924 RepID=UPI00140C0454|nr:RNA-binding protein [Diaphorobacter sp. HDW4A]QIL80292.1 RNA-binding protein [Diaphorobacter sp. HDW4A]